MSPTRKFRGRAIITIHIYVGFERLFYWCSRPSGGYWNWYHATTSSSNTLWRLFQRIRSSDNLKRLVHLFKSESARDGRFHNPIVLFVDKGKSIQLPNFHPHIVFYEMH